MIFKKYGENCKPNEQTAKIRTTIDKVDKVYTNGKIATKSDRPQNLSDAQAIPIQYPCNKIKLSHKIKFGKITTTKPQNRVLLSIIDTISTS
ncbi:hypothetical protein [Moraxella marmotae]|uniref:hypothetical protein n=1 Tax=Moraxella marmotae TaxID=3344520 RepID=UPI0035F3B00F